MTKIKCLVSGEFKHHSESQWLQFTKFMVFYESLNTLYMEFKKAALDTHQLWHGLNFSLLGKDAHLPPEPDCFKSTDIEIVDREEVNFAHR